jgi:hypothetical protein
MDQIGELCTRKDRWGVVCRHEIVADQEEYPLLEAKRKKEEEEKERQRQAAIKKEKKLEQERKEARRLADLEAKKKATRLRRGKRHDDKVSGQAINPKPAKRKPRF